MEKRPLLRSLPPTKYIQQSTAQGYPAEQQKAGKHTAPQLVRLHYSRAGTHLVRDRRKVRFQGRRESEAEVGVRAVPALHAQKRLEGLVVDVTTLQS